MAGRWQESTIDASEIAQLSRASSTRGRGVLEGRLKLMTRLTGLLAAFVLVAVSFGARAEPVIDITTGGVKPMPIAIPEFFGNGPDAQIGADVARVVSDDLERSGLFAPIDHKAFIQDAAPGTDDLTLAEAACLLEVPAVRLRAWLVSGKLPGRKAGREWRLARRDVLELLNSGRLRGRSRRLDPRWRGQP